jgi:site-specific recombinase XerD
VGAARPHGRFDRPDGPFSLALGLRGPGGLPLGEAVDLVVDDWHRQLAEDKVAPVTVGHAEQNIRRFVAFAAGRGVRTLAEVDAKTCQAFCDARNAPPDGRPASPRGGAPAAVGTKNSRKVTLRTFFVTCALLGLDDRDPTTNVVVPRRTSQRFVRALTDAELDRCRHRSRKSVGETRLPAACALASRGVTTAELPAIRVRDLFLDDALLWAHGGGTRTQARWVDLDQCSPDALRRRVEDLTSTVPSDQLLDTPLVYKPMSSAVRPEKRQAAAAVTLGQVLDEQGGDVRDCWLHARHRGIGPSCRSRHRSHDLRQSLGPGLPLRQRAWKRACRRGRDRASPRRTAWRPTGPRCTTMLTRRGCRGLAAQVVVPVSSSWMRAARRCRRSRSSGRILSSSSAQISK